MTTKEAMVVEESPGAQTLAVVSRETGVMALASLTEADFEARLNALKVGQERIRKIQRELMEEGEDYGVIPGTKKPSLLKAGSEKICQVYNLKPMFPVDLREIRRGDGEVEPNLEVIVTCRLHLGDEHGPVVGEGLGAANSWERKYRYRMGERSCPECGVEGSIRRSKFEERGDRGWYCWEKKGGCNAKFASTDPRIAEQHAGEVQNPDPYDAQNTLLKMAAKRAQVDATLRVTATSGLFTQDVEDMASSPAPETDEGPRSETRSVRAPAPARASVPAATETEREPGADDEDYYVETSEGPVRVGSGERAAAAGAEQNEMFDQGARPEPRRSAPPANEGGEIPACPQGHRGRQVMRSRKPQYGAYYCHSCGKGYGPKVAGGAR